MINQKFHPWNLKRLFKNQTSSKVIETNTVTSPVWNAFLEHFRGDQDLMSCLDPESEVCRVSITKWSEEWEKVHEKAIDLAELLPFFGNGPNVRYSGVDSSMSKVREAKIAKRSSLPDDETRNTLLSFYKSCIDECQAFVEAPLTRQNLVESMDLNIGQHMYTLKNYPWVTFTPEAPIEIIQGEPILIHCEILPSADCFLYGEYPQAKPATLLAVERKVYTALSMIEQSFHGKEAKAHVFLLTEKGECILQRRYSLHDLDDASSIEFNVKLAAIHYAHTVLKHLDESVETYGEFWEEGQQQGVIEKGTVVFNAGGRGQQSKIGTVVEIDEPQNVSKVKVHWRGKDEPSKKWTKAEKLLVVPVTDPTPPTREGQMAIVCAGHLPELYGKWVRVERLEYTKVFFQPLKGGEQNICLHRKHLHAPGTSKCQARHSRFVRIFRGAGSFGSGPDKKRRMLDFIRRHIPGEQKNRYVLYWKDEPTSPEQNDHSVVGSPDTHFHTALSRKDSDSSADQVLISREQDNIFAHKYLRDAVEQIDRFTTDGHCIRINESTCKKLQEDCTSGGYREWYGNDAIDLWVSYISFRYPLVHHGIHVVHSALFSLLYTETGEQNESYFKDIQNLDSLFTRYSRKAGIHEYQPSIILFPIVHSAHWSLVVIGNIFSQETAFAVSVDSMDNDFLRFDWSVIQRFIGSIAPMNSSLKYLNVRNAPKQNDAHNCGPFTIAFMEAISTEFQNKTIFERGSTGIISASSLIDRLESIVIRESCIRSLRKVLAGMASAAHSRESVIDDFRTSLTFS